MRSAKTITAFALIMDAYLEGDKLICWFERRLMGTMKMSCYLTLNHENDSRMFAGTPQPEVMFYKNGKLIDLEHEEGRFEIIVADGVCRLSVKEATLADSGEYMITAVNERGKISHSVSVGVQPEGVKYVFHEFFVIKEQN